MKTNMGNLDRSVRILIALLAIILYYQGIINGVWLTVALIVSAVFLITSILGFCPLYKIIGVNSCSANK